MKHPGLVIILVIMSFGIGFFSGEEVGMNQEGKKIIERKKTSMKKVTGVGGIFFKVEDPQKTKDWYKNNLGFDTDQYGTNFEWVQSDNSAKKGFTQWSPFTDKTKYFEPSTKDFMINYRVENLEELVNSLREAGVTIVDSIETYEYGKFVHIMDPDGHKVELWEPIDEEYDKLVEGRTK